MKKFMTVAILSLAFAANACTAFTFNGQTYCPEESVVLPCTSANCLSRSAMRPVLPEAPTLRPPRVVAVVAPVDAADNPAEYVNICNPSCHVQKAPIVVVEYPRYQPPAAYWYQPPAVAVPTVVGWGVWNTMNGPPLRRRR